jgi:peptidoglycan/LPS O-acetylase OafA/YrhL
LGMLMSLLPNVLVKVIGFIGGITLELYLLHEFLMFNLLPHMHFNIHVEYIVIILITIACAYTAHWGVVKVVEKIR